MLKNVKFRNSELTPDLIKRIQLTVFANGYSWLDGSKNLISESEAKSICESGRDFLAINNNGKLILSGYQGERFEDYPEKEISPYAFVVSGGELEYIPTCGEEAYFSNDKEFWIKKNFLYFNPRTLKFVDFEDKEWDVCRPLNSCF
jgi:hypothetical protein